MVLHKQEAGYSHTEAVLCKKEADTSPNTNPMVTDSNNYKIEYFLLMQELDKASANKYRCYIRTQECFTVVNFFDNTFSLQVKTDSKLYNIPPRCMAFVLQKSFKEELDWLQQKHIITPLGVDRTAEWRNSFILIPNLNGRVRLCLDPARLNHELI